MNQDREDTSLPEGFAADENGNFMGIPPWAMRQANMLMAGTTGNRSWDVAQIGHALADVFDHRMNEILLNVERTVAESFTKLQSERQVTREQLNVPLDAPLRTSELAKLKKRTATGPDIDDEEHAPFKDKTPERQWRLMPVLHNGKAGLTDEMMRAFYDAVQHCSLRGDFERLNVGYNAMVKAAPKTKGWTFNDEIPKPNPEWIQRWTYEALVQAADICRAYANGFVSDVNPERSSERAKGAQACAEAIMVKAQQLDANPDTDKRIHAATLAFLGSSEPTYRPVSVDWMAERHFKFSEWQAHLKLAIETYLGTSL